MPARPAARPRRGALACARGTSIRRSRAP